MIRRGSVVLTALPGDYGKSRPAVVVQSDLALSLDSVVLCLLTSFHQAAPDLRVAIAPSEQNGLLQPSYVMIEKVFTVRRDKLRAEIGRLDADSMAAISRGLAVLLGLP